MTTVKRSVWVLLLTALLASCGARSGLEGGNLDAVGARGGASGAQAGNTGGGAIGTGAVGSFAGFANEGGASAGNAGKSGSSGIGGSTGVPGVPRVVVPPSPDCGELHLALSDDLFCWTDRKHGAVHCVRSNLDGLVVDVAINEPSPGKIAFGSDSLYWLNDDRTLRRSFSGSVTSLFESMANDVGGFALSPDGQWLYFSRGSSILRLPSAGGALVESGRSTDGTPRAVAADDERIVYTSSVNVSTDLYFRGTTPAVCGGNNPGASERCQRIAVSQGGLDLENVYLVDGVAYWANFGNVIAASAVGSQTLIAQASPAANSLRAWYIGNGYAYLLDDNGNLTRSSLYDQALPEELLASGQSPGTSIVANTTTVYWSTQNCAIVAMTLP